MPGQRNSKSGEYLRQTDFRRDTAEAVKRVGSNISGLTLLEALVSLSLIGIALVIFSGIFTQMSEVRKVSQEGEDFVAGLSVLEEIRREVSSATAVTLPASPTFETELIFEKVIPGLSDRLPEPGRRWSPLDPMHNLSFHYRLDDSNLVKETSSPGSKSSSVVAQGLDAFSVALIHPKVVEIRLSFRKGKRLRLVSTKALRWSP